MICLKTWQRVNGGWPKRIRVLPLKNNDDRSVSDVLSYSRVMNNEDIVDYRTVQNVKKETKDRKNYWTLKELEKQENLKREK